MADGLVIYAKARAFKAMATKSRPRPRLDNPKAKKFGLKAKAKDSHLLFITRLKLVYWKCSI